MPKTTCFCLACGKVFDTTAALDGHQLKTGHEMDQPDHPLRKPRTLRRDSIGYGYETSDGRYEVIPAYTPSCTSLGGRTRRPSYWILKDRKGEHATVQRTLLADIRDILKERA